MPANDTPNPTEQNPFQLDFEKLFQNMVPGIVVHNAEGAITYANQSAERLLGLTIDEMNGRTPVDPRWHVVRADGTLFPTDDLPAMRTLHTQEAVRGVTLGVSLPDDSIRWLMVNTRPLFNNTVFNGVEVSFINITPYIEKAERDLIEAVEKQRIKILADFISDATHEFRTPLAIILTKVHLLRKRHGDLLADSPDLAMIETQVHSITALVDNLALLSRLDKRTTWTMQIVQPHKLIHDLVDVYTNKFSGTIKRDLFTDDLSVFASEAILFTALEKIMDNAVKFTPDDGTITIRTLQHGYHLFIEIEDTGIGMPADVVARATERFYRPDESRNARGFGLGLAIAHRIIHVHSSELQIKSEVGKGTTVTIPLVLTTASRL